MLSRQLRSGALSDGTPGSRFCIGQRLSLIEMSYVLVRIFQRYSRVELRMGETCIVEKHDLDWLRKGSEPELAERVKKDR